MPQERPRTLIDELIGLYRADPHFAKVLIFVAIALTAVFVAQNRQQRTPAVQHDCGRQIAAHTGTRVFVAGVIWSRLLMNH